MVYVGSDILSFIHYLDNSATTKPCTEAVDALNKCLLENWGNPSSLYSLGMNAEDELISCREIIAKKLSCRPDEIFFTGSGTEANNIAIRGAVLSRAKRGKRIVTTAFEHPSVSNTIDALKSEFGFEVVKLRPDKSGHVPDTELEKAITPDTIFVSLMLVNNEIGSVQNISLASELIKKVSSPALLHTDAVQGFGKLDIKPNNLGVDLLSASGHKIHAPKGIGFLYIKKGVHIHPTVFGGGQQNGIRPGTEPVPMIAALGAAVSALPEAKSAGEKVKKLNAYAREKLTSLGFVDINSPDDALPYVLNISVVGYRSETLLHFLEARNVFVSSGSACAKGELSPTLSALGLEKSRIDSALRISFSRYNTFDDIDALCEGLTLAVSKLKKSKG